MSLKSGMLAECTWAIDTLNILLHDDKTIFILPSTAASWSVGYFDGSFSPLLHGCF